MLDLVDVQCADCGEIDQVWWSDFGAEENCPVCQSSPVELFRIN